MIFGTLREFEPGAKINFGGWLNFVVIGMNDDGKVEIYMDGNPLSISARDPERVAFRSLTTE